jgi:phosphopantetheinyl transferase
VNTILIDIKNVKIALMKVDDVSQDIPQNTVKESSTSKNRLREKAGVSLLLESYHPNLKLEYNSNGKPFVTPKTFAISISHNQEWIGLAWSTLAILGLDIERINPRIEKVSDRFLHGEELNFIKTLRDKTAVWCIKECLIKLTDNKKLNLKNELRVEKIDEDNWLGYSTLQQEKMYQFYLFEQDNSLICINTN